MELKLLRQVSESNGCFAYNRTILELKLFDTVSLSLLKWLIIAPYWNWNAYRRLVLMAGGTLIIAPYWNWNFKIKHLGMWVDSAYNRTILELKPYCIYFCISYCVLIIAPYWNWNIVAKILFFVIEYLIIAPYWNWNISLINTKKMVHLLIIAPYWNWN